jgi:2-polyprenylphenol 6-hydroxylase
VISPPDILIVGGGPVGWASALACVRAHPKASIAAVDRAEPPAMPSGMLDTRVYTVTEDNLAWLASCGVELDETRTAEVDTIRVFDQAGNNSLTVDARDARSERLAKVVEHDALTAAIALRAKALGVRFIRGEAKGSGILDDRRYVELADNNLLSAKLAIVAEGANSKLRDAIGIRAIQRDYERVGVVAHFNLANAHCFEARQWFLPDRSILALLPLPDIHNKPAASMVWSTTKTHGEQLAAMSPQELCATVANATNGQVAIEAALTPCVAFPLRMVRSDDPVAERALVVGDAAHAVHPLAGQGVNLGFGDARALEEVLTEAARVGHDFGHALLLSKFRRNRYAAVLAMQAATDGLARIYNLNTSYLATTPLSLAAIGDLGMRVLGKLPAFRRLVSSAAG